MAYNKYLINPISNNEYIGWEGARQQEELSTAKGGVNEAQFAFGANYKDKLYIGGGLGIPIINYDRERTLLEKDSKGEVENILLQDENSGNVYEFDFENLTYPRWFIC